MKMSEETTDLVPVYDADAANQLIQLYVLDPKTNRHHRVHSAVEWVGHYEGRDGRYSWYRVGGTTHGPFEIATVFLGIDHSFFPNSGAPLLYETCVFYRNGAPSLIIDRYSSWWEAIQAHELISLDYQLRWRSVIASKLAVGLLAVSIAAVLGGLWWRAALGYAFGSCASMYLLWFTNWYGGYARLTMFRSRMKARLRAALRRA